MTEGEIGPDYGFDVIERAAEFYAWIEGAVWVKGQLNLLEQAVRFTAVKGFEIGGTQAAVTGFATDAAAEADD